MPRLAERRRVGPRAEERQRSAPVAEPDLHEQRRRGGGPGEVQPGSPHSLAGDLQSACTKAMHGAVASEGIFGLSCGIGCRV